jgi:hypothetical protein
MNVNVRACVKEREVKESVRIELVKALRQAQFILTGRDIARSGFITTNVLCRFFFTSGRIEIEYSVNVQNYGLFVML